MRLARLQLGRPYRYGAKVTARPGSFDCSSLVQWLYRQVGIELPRRSLEQAARGRKVAATAGAMRPGDLLFFTGSVGHYDKRFPQGIGHVAMYAGDKHIIHAVVHDCFRRRVERVMQEPLQLMLKRRDLVAAKRVLR